MDDSNHVRQEVEIDRLCDELADRFRQVPPDVIEAGLRDEFNRRSDYPVQDFVPIFVARSVRERLRSGS